MSAAPRFDKARATLYGLYGALLFLRGDMRGWSYFAPSRATARFSFRAALYALIPQFVIVILGNEDGSLSALLEPDWLVTQLSAAVLGWTAFPLMLLFYGRIHKLEARSWVTVAALNWFYLYQLLFYLVPFVFFWLGILPHGVLEAVKDLLFCYFLVIEGVILNTGLRVGMGPTIGLLIMDPLISYAISQAVNYLLASAASAAAVTPAITSGG